MCPIEVYPPHSCSAINMVPYPFFSLIYVARTSKNSQAVVNYHLYFFIYFTQNRCKKYIFGERNQHKFFGNDIGLILIWSKGSQYDKIVKYCRPFCWILYINEKANSLFVMSNYTRPCPLKLANTKWGDSLTIYTCPRWCRTKTSCNCSLLVSSRSCIPCKVEKQNQNIIWVLYFIFI